MSSSISGTTIKLTRGDSFVAKIHIDGYTPQENDRIRFAMKKDFSDERPCIKIEVPINTMILSIEPSDTKDLEFGYYMYDIQLTTTSGYTDTFIDGKFKLTEEVD